ncbi:podocalyxin-like protein 2 isoform X1 [Poecilia latipinna]|uniref:podocalyxin-like protein 2 isoform X1 n=1 Tax=Poecilia latipinna TaxID=48699 RepID=UPI00072DD65B|nr:PREDICTED: podocalyxin-like protein 2 isoform X1 [Poecilia latipinna]
MPGLIITLIALLSSSEAFGRGSTQRVIPLGPPPAPLLPGEVQGQSRFIQELVRTKRHSARELVRAQPHLVHDMGWPEIHETSGSQSKQEPVNPSAVNPTSAMSPPPAMNQEVARTLAAVDESLDVEEVMERMVHLAVPLGPDSAGGHLELTEPEAERHGGLGAGDASQEASGFDGTDTEDRDRGDDGGEDQDRRGGGGEDEWERYAAEDRERRGEEDKTGRETDERGVTEAVEVNHTTPDLYTLIDYRSFFHPSKEPSRSFLSEEHDFRPQEHRGPSVLELSPSEKDLWIAEKDEDVQSSGYGVLRSSVAAAQTSPTPPDDPAVSADSDGTATPETDTGTDFGLLESYTKDDDEEEAGLPHAGVITQNPTAPEVGLAPSRRPLQPSLEQDKHWEEREHDLKETRSEELEEEREEREGSRFRGIIPLTTDPSHTTGFTATGLDPGLEEPRQVGWFKPDDSTGNTRTLKNISTVNVQVVCVNWNELTGRGYVVLNMTKNMNCEEFRVCGGVQLLKILEREFARRMNSPEGSWVLYLSKPTHQQHQLLMNVASAHGVIATQEVLDMLGEIKKGLDKVGIQNYSAATSCQSRPSKTRSDYGKLFVVLVIIGSICMVIITSGFIYICWQRRLPGMKSMFPAEELHSVENGYHDNPTLDVTNDSQAEMREKKPSTNGLTGAGGGGGDDSSRWQAFVNQAATEDDEEEQDTHL